MTPPDATVKTVSFLAVGSFGPYILLHEDYVDNASTKELTRRIGHELVHVWQWKKYTWQFPLRYAWQLLKNGYEDNAYEVQARRFERDLRFKRKSKEIVEQLWLNQTSKTFSTRTCACVVVRATA